MTKYLVSCIQETLVVRLVDANSVEEAEAIASSTVDFGSYSAEYYFSAEEASTEEIKCYRGVRILKCQPTSLLRKKMYSK